MAKIMLPSFLQDELEESYFYAEIHCINDLKKNLYEQSSILNKHIFDSESKEFKNTVRFILNNKLLGVNEYDVTVSENDEIALLIQFTGG